MFEIYKHSDLSNPLPLTVMNFPDHEGFVKFDAENENYDIVWRYEGDHELVTLGMICDLLEEFATFKRHHLFIPYFPHARQDRRTATNQPYSLKVFENMLNSAIHTTISTVYCIDLHSNKLQTIVRENRRSYDVVSLPSYGYAHAFDFSNIDCLICPDEGAQSKVQMWGDKDYLDKPILFCSKSRDPSTGKLSLPTIVNPENLRKGWRYLLVDDIGTGFGTHIQLAEHIDNMVDYNPPIDIFVTHAGLTRGLQPVLDVFENLYCSDSLIHGQNVIKESLPELQSRVFVRKIMDSWRNFNGRE